MTSLAKPQKYRAGLVGVTGYTGMELARILAIHPCLELVCVTSRTDAGKKVQDIYPSMSAYPLGQLPISQPDPEQLAENCDVVFLAVPHGAAMEMAGLLRRCGVKVVDLSSDFRLRDVAVYEEWYQKKHLEKECLAEAVYGLPELYEPAIKNAGLIANPGCYPTASILGLYPLLKNKLVSLDNIIIDAKSGTTGAGRKAAVSSLFCEVQDNFRAYGVPGHRHIPEIEQELSCIAQAGLTVSFTPHLLPVNRGILATIYAQANGDVCQERLREAYLEEYSGCRFIRILPSGQLPELRFVRGTMFCDISVIYDKRVKRVVVLSAIDNLCRGASGQAVANANLMLGLPLNSGLELVPLNP